MPIDAINARSVRKISDTELISLHHRLHQLASRARGADRERYWNAHHFVATEMGRRGKHHNIIDWLDRPLKEHESLKPVLIVPDYLCIVGSSVDPRIDQVSDIDLLIRDTKDRGWAASIGKMYQEGPDDPPLHFIYNPQGPNDLYVPVADLVLTADPMPRAITITESLSLSTLTIPAVGEVVSNVVHLSESLKGWHSSLVRPLQRQGLTIRWGYDKAQAGLGLPVKLSLVPRGNLVAHDPKAAASLIIAESVTPGRAFQPLKSRAGYHKGEFYDLDSLWEFWAAGVIDRGIAVEPKYDGYRIVAHRKGGNIKLLTEDTKRNVAARLPQLVKELKALPGGDYVLDGELTIRQDGKPLPHSELAGVLFGHEPDTVDYRYYVFDCLYANGQSLDDKPWSERQKALKAIVRNSQHIARVVPTVAHNRTELMKAIKAAAARPESEGAMLKVADGKYDLSGHSAVWAKYKRIYELKVKVLGRKQTAGGEWIYRCSFRNAKGRLQPIESQQKFSGTDEPGWEMLSKKPQGDYELGRTYATKLRVPLGSIITVAPTYMAKWEDAKGVHYSWMNPRVRDWDKARLQPDDQADVERIVQSSKPLWQGKQEAVVMEAANIFMVEQGNKPFRFTVQIHSRGVLTSDDLAAAKKAIIGAADEATRERLWRKAGFLRCKVPLKQILERIAQEPSSRAAQYLDSQLDKAMPSTIDWAQTVQRGNAHIDLRIATPEDHLIGWTLLTPGIALQRASDGAIFYGLNRFAKQADSDWKDKAPQNETVIRALQKQPNPVVWLTIVTPKRPRLETAPGHIGATEETAGIFELFDMGYCAYGMQKSDYHEYFLKFDKHKALNGRWNAVRLADRWLFSRAKDQRPYITTHNKPGGLPNESALAIIKCWGFVVNANEQERR